MHNRNNEQGILKLELTTSKFLVPWSKLKKGFGMNQNPRFPL
jgi:hypothetical protein